MININRLISIKLFNFRLLAFKKWQEKLIQLYHTYSVKNIDSNGDRTCLLDML
jgi:hypothetical protein